MDEDNEKGDEHGHGEVFRRTTEGKASRKLRARSGRDTSIWFWLGNFGLVGWSVAIPTVAGAAIGRWMDERWPGEISWTLTFLVVGLLVGCGTAWYWVKREGRHD